jgi:acetyltransferase-like isoleucine patch superfamily enzyme
VVFEQDVQIDVFGDAAEIGNYVYLGENCELKTDRILVSEAHMIRSRGI